MSEGWQPPGPVRGCQGLQGRGALPTGLQVNPKTVRAMPQSRGRGALRGNPKTCRFHVHSSCRSLDVGRHRLTEVRGLFSECIC